MITYIVMFIVAMFHLTLDMWIPMSELQSGIGIVVGNIWLVGAMITLQCYNR
jgi:hypothetical protein